MDADPEAQHDALETLEKLRKRHADIQRTDYFQAPEVADLLAQLTRLGQSLAGEDSQSEQVDPDDPEDYRGRIWVTRPRPHVDRLASAWLIRRIIDPAATVHYRDQAREDEVAFDMPSGGFSHIGRYCTFEVLLRAFLIDDPALMEIAEIVHELDLNDASYARPEIAGVGAVLDGWQHLEILDEEREANGAALFEGLYAAFGGGPTTGIETGGRGG